MTDLDAILAQLAEGHWPRPTAELGRAIVERIRDAEAERDDYLDAALSLAHAVNQCGYTLPIALRIFSQQIEARLSACPAPAAGEE